MEKVADALAQLGDEATRARVLNWASERFCRTALVAPPAAQPAAAAGVDRTPLRAVAAPDDGLSVPALAEMFAGPRTHRDPSQSVNGMLREFVADFQEVVHEWNEACAPETQSPTKARIK